MQNEENNYQQYITKCCANKEITPIELGCSSKNLKAKLTNPYCQNKTKLT